ncbi:MAG: 2-oxo acid dehydrogenase subunit E2 [Gammaproteobacteria bacterium]|nr:2-oxo acid dehydrogenase subunit E2 [Gammaproteobacteria bacterium]MBQ0838351.1 2-oxo acid dehydrogenase subunit E2 [Gammaproteobacteria bacterium]
MSNIYKIPELGDGDITGTVVSLVVKVGDTVNCGDSLIEVETEKAILELPAEIDGVVEAFLVAPDQVVKQGESFISIKALAKSAGAAPVEAESTHKPAQQESPAPVKSCRQKPPSSDGNSSDGNSSDNNSDNNSGNNTGQKSAVAIQQTTSSQCLPAGPATRRLARELGVDLARISEAGHGGRIDKAAVKAFAKQMLSQQQNNSPSLQMPALPDLSAFGPLTVQPMSGIQKATSRNMTQAAARIPHAWLQRRIDITQLEQGRQQHKAQLKSEGCALTLTALLGKIIGLACARHPIFNASLDEQNQEIIFRQNINLGIAVDTPRGLVVPVLNDISSQSVKEIALQITQLSEKARAGKLQPKEMKGGSITLSNLGGLGASGVFPIINWPEVAIIGVGAGEWLPTYVGGDINAPPEPRLIMPLTLAFDHRVINGADGARFLDTVAELCENPFLVLVG